MVASKIFFLDTNIIISELFDQNRERIEKFKSDCTRGNVLCLVSESVVEEADELIANTLTLIGNQFSVSLNQFLQQKGLTGAIAISRINITELEEFFLPYTLSRPPKDYLPEVMKVIEFFIITSLEKYRIEQPNLSLSKFMAELVGQLLELSTGLDLKYDKLIRMKEEFAKKDHTQCDETVHEKLLLDALTDPDAKHIASASGYKQKKGMTPVFVTQDKNTILVKKGLIYKESCINCCDPLYAIHY